MTYWTWATLDLVSKPQEGGRFNALVFDRTQLPGATGNVQSAGTSATQIFGLFEVDDGL